MSAQYLSYTYLIGWTEQDTWYYGVRTANKHEPENDLWIYYFTSSKYVQEFRELHGDPDVIQIDETFDDKEKAIEFEVQKLNEFDVLNESKWLNQCIAGSYIRTDEILARLSEVNKDITKRKEHSKRQSGKGNSFYGRKHTPETKMKTIRSNLAKYGVEWPTQLPEVKEKLRKARAKQVITEEQKQKTRAALKGRKIHTESSRRRISESKKKPIEIDGIVYPSLTEASEQLGRNITTVCGWAKNGKARYL